MEALPVRPLPLRPARTAAALPALARAAGLALFTAFALVLAAGDVRADERPARRRGSTPVLEQQVRSLALAAPAAAAGGRDPRRGRRRPARSAPAPGALPQVEPYLPNNMRLWGKSRIGLRCTGGPTRWNVYLPITVKV